MSMIDGSKSFKLFDLETWYGDVTRADGSKIIISSEDETSVFTGSFSYDIYGDVYGTLTGYKEFYRGSEVVEFSDFAVDANVAFAAIDSGNSEGLIEFVMSSDDDVWGSHYADKIAGFGGDDLLVGRSGDDVILGGSGNDFLVGGKGADTIHGGSGSFDTASYVNAESGVTVSLSASRGITGEAAGDVLRSIENLSGSDFSDNLIGNGASNWLFGSAGSDRLSGLGGWDYLYGEEGRNRLFGGGGSDVFEFRNTPESRNKRSTADRIEDFAKGEDLIDVSRIDASTILGGNDAFVFRGTAGFTTSDEGEIYYKQFDNVGTNRDYTMVYFSTDDDIGPEMAIRLTGLVDMTADDFVL